ncbi:MAG: hypothetical protein A2W19_13355 [Spirochaetes bacterium RBG_16_49_21]|nr:MAG: hypothetical protein A2W19_13355 [Spirochaetes bacterium RBG_16_49_21]
MDQQRVVVSGIGLISPIGSSTDVFFDSLVKGNPGIKEISAFKTDGFKSKLAGEIVNFAARNFISSKNIRYLDKISQFSIAAANLALNDSNLIINDKNYSKIGIVLGSMYFGLNSLSEVQRILLEDKEKKISPMIFPNTVPNSPVSQVSIELGVKSLCTMMSTGFCSSTDAIGWSVNYIRKGMAQAIFVGGAEELNQYIYGIFEKNGLLSYSNSHNKEQCAPFNTSRNGLILSEGAAVLLLESYNSAKERNAKIYGEIIGYGGNYCASSMKKYDYDSAYTTRAMECAIKDALVEKNDIDYICTEGNGTVLSDQFEADAIKHVFDKINKKIPISSIKSVLGHTVGAAGAFNVVATLLSMRENVIPPVLNFDENADTFGLEFISNKARSANIRYALTNSFCPWGNVSSLVIRNI